MDVRSHVDGMLESIKEQVREMEKYGQHAATLNVQAINLAGYAARLASLAGQLIQQEERRSSTDK